MKYLAFAGDYYTERFGGGGWHGAVGGADTAAELEELTAAAEEKAKALLTESTAPGGLLVMSWYHVVDMDTLEIIHERKFSDYGGPNRRKATP